MKTINRLDLLNAIYLVSGKKELLTQFDTNLSTVKSRKSSDRYTHLLEQIVYFSHAIVYGHGVQTAHNYRQSFMDVARANTKLNLSDKLIDKAFSFLNRTDKKRIVKKAKEITSPKPTTATKAEKGDCIAKTQISLLKDSLDNETYVLSRGQKKQDKEIFIQIAIIAMATGGRLQDIMKDLTITKKGNKVSFNGTISVLLGLDVKTAQSYLRAIRKHYSDRITKGIDISTGIRKAVRKLEIPTVEKAKETGNSTETSKTEKEDKTPKAQNLNHLNNLYKSCIAS